MAPSSYRALSCRIFLPGLLSPQQRPTLTRTRALASMETASAEKPADAGSTSAFAADASAGLVVFLVALPLCLGIALASGAPLLSGVVAGIVGGIVVSLLSGSAVSVSGPAAGLAVIVATAIQTLGSFEAFLLAVLLAGVAQLGFGLVKAGRIANYVPNSVIKGMLAAIGVVIILKQLPHALGRDKGYEGDFDFFRSASGQSTTLSDIADAIASANGEAILISLVSLAILLLCERPFIKSRPSLKLIPGALIAVIVGIALNELFRASFTDFWLRAEDGHLVTLPAGGPREFLALLSSPDWSRLGDRAIYTTALTLAIVASIESLLSLEASDKIDPQRRISDPDRELIAQGCGNIVSSLLGGLPVTAVIVRSSANVYAGARTRWSAFIHGLLLVACVLLIPAFLNRIPLATLAAVLLMVGYKLTKPALYREMWASGLDQFIPFIITVLAIVFTDLLTGVSIGIVFGIVFVIRTNHHSAFTLVRQDQMFLLRFNKDASFVNKTEFKRKLMQVPDNASLIVDGSKAIFIDSDIYDVMSDFEEAAKHRQISIELKNFLKKSQNYRNRRRDNGIIQEAAAR
jgi:MFS superfamily sulfate permease-like transporter